MSTKTIESLINKQHDLTHTQVIGVAWPWWIYSTESKLIDDATRGAFLEVWINNVDSSFAMNQGSARPTNCKELINALRLNEKHYYRSYRPNKPGNKARSHGHQLPPHSTASAKNRRRGPSVPATKLRYDHATILGVSEGVLSPSLPEYVAKSAVWLVSLAQPGRVEMRTPTISDSAALAYALYVLKRIDHRGRMMDANAILQLAIDLEANCNCDPVEGIFDTARAVGEVLKTEVKFWIEALKDWEPNAF